MDYQQAVKTQESLENDVKAAGQVLQGFPRPKGGLTPDHIKFSEEYQQAKHLYDLAFQRLREFNSSFVKARKQHQSREKQEKRIVKAGGVKVKPQGRAEAWQVGNRLLWLNCGNGSQVLVGYAHNPEQQGVIMSLTKALEAGKRNASDKG